MRHWYRYPMAAGAAVCLLGESTAAIAWRACVGHACRRGLRKRTVSGLFFLVAGKRGAWWVVGQGETPVGRTCERVPNRSKGVGRLW